MGSFLPQITFRWWKEDGTVAYNWTAGFYKAGLDPISANLKEIYSDLDQATPIANPAAFDVEGKVTIVLGSGGYKVVIRDENDVVKYTQDNILGTGGFGTGFGCQFVDTIADLKALDAASSAFCYVAGYFAALDGGHHMFRWNDSASAADNGGSVISPDSAPTLGRWEWVPDEGDYVRAKAFGVIPDGSTDRSAALLSADAYAFTIGKKLLIEGDTVGSPLNISGAVALTASVVEMTPGFFFYSTGTISFAGYFIGGHQLRFSGGFVGDLGVTFSAQQISDSPEQFGAVADGSTDNLAMLNYWKASGGGAYSLPPGDWFYGGTWVEPTKPIRYLGRIVNGDATIQTGFNFPDTSSRGRLGFIDTSYGITFDGSIPDRKSIYPQNFTIDDYGLETDAPIFHFLGDVRADGDGEIGGQLDVTGDITGDNIQGAGNVQAGAFLIGKAGSGSVNFYAGGKYSTVIGSAGTGGTAATNLLSTVLYANSLIDDLDSIRITAAGIGGTSADNHPRIITIKIGTKTVFTAAISPFGGANYWRVVVDVYKSGGSFFASGVLTMQDASDAQVGYSNAHYATDTLDLTVNQTIQVIGQATVSGSMTQKILCTEILPSTGQV